MKTENVSTLKIHQMSQAQYDRESEAGNLEAHSIYLTPDEEIDLSSYATIEYVDSKTPILFELDYDNTTFQLSFKNGQTAEQLISLLENDRPVIVRYKTGSGYINLRYTSKFTIDASLPNGTSYGFEARSIFEVLYYSLNHEGFVYGGRNEIVDYVVESGVDGNWSYQKWNLGKMEAWGIVDLTATSVQGNNEVAGLSQITASCNFPAGMLRSNIEYCSLAARDYRIFGNMTSTSNVLWGRFTTYESFANSLILNESTISANAMIIGRWK